LDLRKAIEIRLTEEEAQLAMSPAPWAAPSSRRPIKFYPETSVATLPKVHGKPLDGKLYEGMKDATDEYKKYPEQLSGRVTWAGKGLVTKAKYIQMFEEWEKAYQDYHESLKPKETSSGAVDPEIPF
jgi:hypothetical protein